MNRKKHFIAVNEGFTCSACGNEVPKAHGTCRNHCTQCLCSLHVDDILPGDRESECKGLMKPVSAMVDKKKEYVITHMCETCGKRSANRMAQDDNFDTIIALVQRTNQKLLQS